MEPQTTKKQFINMTLEEKVEDLHYDVNRLFSRVAELSDKLSGRGQLSDVCLCNINGPHGVCPTHNK